MKNEIFNIVISESNIDWTGRKITGSHFGTISIRDGFLSASNGKLTGGRFVIDTRSINILDVTDPATNAQFAGHLASADFFSSAQYPEAVLEVSTILDKRSNEGSSGDHTFQNSGHQYRIKGNLTIKNITHPIEFDARVDISGDLLTAGARIVVDRTKYGMKFRSGNFFQNLGDTLIYDDFNLLVHITAKAA